MAAPVELVLNSTEAGREELNIFIRLFRNTQDYKYCEARYGSIFEGPSHISMMEADRWRDAPGAPYIEWGACTSAGFISLCGCHMLLFWRHESPLLHVISAMYVINGFGAFMAHRTLTHKWHDFDGHSMALAAWLTAGFLCQEVTDNLHRRRTHEGRRAFERSVFWTIVLFIYYWFTSTNAVLPNGVEIGDAAGPVFIGLPMLLSVVVTVVVIRLRWLHNDYVPDDVARKGARYFSFGLTVALFGVTSWLLTELTCDALKFMRYFPGHFVWHIAMAYGSMMMLMLGAIMRADNYKKLPRIGRPHRRGRVLNGPYNILQQVYFAIMPELAMHDPELDAEDGLQNAVTRMIKSSTQVLEKSPGVRHGLRRWKLRAFAPSRPPARIMPRQTQPASESSTMVEAVSPADSNEVVAFNEAEESAFKGVVPGSGAVEEMRCESFELEHGASASARGP